MGDDKETIRKVLATFDWGFLVDGWESVYECRCKCGGECERAGGSFSIGDIVCIYGYEYILSNVFVVHDILTTGKDTYLLSISFPGESERFNIGFSILRHVTSVIQIAVAKTKEAKRLK